VESPITAFRRLTLVPQGAIVVISAFLPIFAIVSMFPALPSLMGHFKDHANAGEIVPWMVTAPGLAIAILAPFAGYFVDRFGRVRLLVWATFFYGFFGIAPFFLESLSLMFVTRLLLGVCEAAILTVVNTLIGDYWNDQGRRDWLYLQGIAGPFMGALVIRAAGPVTEWRWNGVFLIYAIAFVIFLLMKSFLFEPKEIGSGKNAAAQEQPSELPSKRAAAFPMGSIVLVGLVTLFSSVIYYLYMVKGALVFNAVGVTSPSRISELASLPALMVMVGAVVFRLLGSRPNGVQLGSFLLIVGAGLFVMGMAHSVGQVVAGIVVQQVGIGMSVPALIAWTQTKLSFAHRGRGMGIWTSCFFLGQFLSPWLSARVETAAGSIQGTFAVAGIAAMIGGAVGLVSVQLRKPTVQSTSAA
jgi:MFS family permease